jgi:hypothetical protein
VFSAVGAGCLMLQEGIEEQEVWTWVWKKGFYSEEHIKLCVRLVTIKLHDFVWRFKEHTHIGLNSLGIISSKISQFSHWVDIKWHKQLLRIQTLGLIALSKTWVFSIEILPFSSTKKLDISWITTEEKKKMEENYGTRANCFFFSWGIS